MPLPGVPHQPHLPVPSQWEPRSWPQAHRSLSLGWSMSRHLHAGDVADEHAEGAGDPALDLDGDGAATGPDAGDDAFKLSVGVVALAEGDDLAGGDALVCSHRSTIADL